MVASLMSVLKEKASYRDGTKLQDEYNICMCLEYLGFGSKALDASVYWSKTGPASHAHGLALGGVN